MKACTDRDVAIETLNWHLSVFTFEVYGNKNMLGHDTDQLHMVT